MELNVKDVVQDVTKLRYSGRNFGVAVWSSFYGSRFNFL